MGIMLMTFINNKVILQVQSRDYWYKFSSELFFCYEFIIQQVDIDSLNEVNISNVDYTCLENLFVYVDKDEKEVLDRHILQLLRIKKKLIKSSACLGEETYHTNLEKNIMIGM